MSRTLRKIVARSHEELPSYASLKLGMRLENYSSAIQHSHMILTLHETKKECQRGCSGECRWCGDPALSIYIYRCGVVNTTLGEYATVVARMCGDVENVTPDV